MRGRVTWTRKGPTYFIEDKEVTKEEFDEAFPTKPLGAPPPGQGQVMNIIEAIKRSKETGERFRRAGWPKAVMYTIAADDRQPFSEEPAIFSLTAVDLLADDWEPVSQEETPLASLDPRVGKRVRLKANGTTGTVRAVHGLHLVVEEDGHRGITYWADDGCRVEFLEGAYDGYIETPDLRFEPEPPPFAPSECQCGPVPEFKSYTEQHTPVSMDELLKRSRELGAVTVFTPPGPEPAPLIAVGNHVVDSSKPNECVYCGVDPTDTNARCVERKRYEPETSGPTTVECQCKSLLNGHEPGCPHAK